MKKTDIVLKEYASKLSVDVLKILSQKLENRVGSDVAEVLDAMSTCSDLDKWLASAKTCDELYDMIDLAQEYIDRELYKKAPELVQI